MHLVKVLSNLWLRNPSLNNLPVIYSLKYNTSLQTRVYRAKTYINPGTVSVADISSIKKTPFG